MNEAENTDITLLTTPDGCRVFATQGREGLGIDIGGHCIVQPIREWFAKAKTPPIAPAALAGEREAGRVMMSAHALCPTYMSHPRRMQWMADYFLANASRPTTQAPAEPARLLQELRTIAHDDSLEKGNRLQMISARIGNALAAKPEDHGLPPYPECVVVGPCVCGSWPGGPCLRCKVIPAALPGEAPEEYPGQSIDRQVAERSRATRRLLKRAGPVEALAPSDEQIIERCNKAGIVWLPADDDADGFPGGFDMTSMAEMRALLALLALAPPAVLVEPAGDESGWLIEHTGALPGSAGVGYMHTTWVSANPPSMSSFSLDKHPFGFTADASKALRFARKEDAEAMLKWHLGLCSPDWFSEPYSVTEHMWPAAPSGVTKQPAPEKYDDVLVPFVALMRNELHDNADKGDRPGWLGMSREQGLLEIYWHTAKLSAAVKNNDAVGVVEHSADVANMAMMLLDICGGLE